MATGVEHDRTPIESHEQLVDYFRAGEKEEEERGVGTEHEKFVLRREDLSMLAYDGPFGIGELFERLVERYDDWRPIRERGRTIGLEGRDGGVSLEPGGQLELSGAVRTTIHETADEFDRHMTQLDEIAGDDLYFLCLGINPLYEPREVPIVPKQRYDIMRSYLPTRGELATSMMKTSCTVQANFDYRSESDAVDIVRTALLISPIVSAIFASSSIRAGRDTGMQSFRGHTWTQTDPDRCGWPAFMYREDWGYEDYVDYLLDVPMFFIRRRGRLIPMPGASFRRFVEEGWGRWEPTMADFELHLTTAFPEIRLKQFVEVRGADGGPRSHILGLPALWKGLLYHEPSRRRARGLLDDLESARHAELFHDVYRDGLRAETPDGRIREMAKDLIEWSQRGLEALAEREDYESEARYLEPLREIVSSGRTLADRVREDFERFDGDARALVETWALSN